MNTSNAMSSCLSPLVRALVAIIGGGLVLLGLVTPLFYVIIPFAIDVDESRITMNVLVAGLGVMATILGVLLFYQGLRSLLARRSGALRFPHARWVIVLGGGLFALTVLCGMVVLLPGGIVSAYVFPPFHVVAQALPPLIALSLAGWAVFPRRPTAEKLHAPTWRQLTSQLAYGSVGAVSLSMFLEVVLLVLLFLFVLVFVLLIPGRLAVWEELVGIIQSNPYWQEDADLLRQVLAMPETLVMLGAVALVIAPLTEETVKALGVALMCHRVRSAGTALVFGLACGAGFAVAESLLNGAGAMDPLEWGSVAVLRFGSSLMHCLTGALMGLGWYYAIWRRQPGRLLGAYLLSLGIHFVWNVLASAMGMVPVLIGEGGALPLSDVVAVSLALLLLVYTAVMLLGLLLLARRVRPAPLGSNRDLPEMSKFPDPIS